MMQEETARPAAAQHPLAVLRAVIGKTQRQLADLVNCSLPTIRAVEQGKLKLSEKLAKRISDETGVGVAWLLAGDSQMPPAVGEEWEFSRLQFENHQAALVRPRTKLSPELYAWRSTARHCRLLLSLLLHAYEKDNLELCSYKVKEALAALEKQFGKDQELGPVPYSQGGKGASPSGKKDLEEAIEVFSRRIAKPKKRTVGKNTHRNLLRLVACAAVHVANEKKVPK